MLLKEIASFFRYLSASNKQSRRLTFYSESAVYYQYFKDLINQYLSSHEGVISYISSDPSDERIERDNPRVRVFYIHRLLPFLMLFMDAKVLVMTMTDLHQFHVRRSVNATHHVYVFHAMVSTHMIYRKGAFDYYDTIFCVGPHHEAEIREMEALYGLPAKRLVAFGYPLLETIVRRHREYLPSSPTETTVLIAPSWAKDNIMDSCLDGVIESLVQEGCRVVVRPHPEYLKRQPHDLALHHQRWRSVPSVTFEVDMLQSKSLHEAAVLITDWSGIALEYALGTERPVLFIETPKKVNNPEFNRLKHEPLEIRMRNILGVVLQPSEAALAGKKARQLVKDRPQYLEPIRALREQSVYHYGTAAQNGADALAKLLS